MSAIKTTEQFHIISGDAIEFSNEDGEHSMTVRSLLVDRQRPQVCQIFTEKENTGSLQSSTKVYNGKIETISPGSVSTEFVVKARVNDGFQELKLKCQRTESSDCCIS